jgi:hypothetical protein
MTHSQYYTCSNKYNIATYGLPSNIDYHGCNGLDCHIELCTVSNPPATLNSDGTIATGYCNWKDENPNDQTLFDFGSSYSDQAFTMYAEYRVYNGTTYYRSPATVYPPPPTQMTLNSSNYPSVTLTSPAGIPNDGTTHGLAGDNCSSGPGSGTALCSGGYQFQQLNINSQYPQAATYTASSSSSPSESVNVTVVGCGSTCNTTSPLVSYQDAPPFFAWWTGASEGEYTSLSLTATDQGGLQTTMQGPAALSLYDAASAPATAPCGLPGSSTILPCLAVADATGTAGGDITGDAQDCSAVNGYIFCGYADPSIRADTTINDGPADSPWANPWGTLLWMSYSVPILNANSNSANGSEVPSVRIDLGYSNDGGITWQSWCDGSDCDGTTPLYPSVGFPQGTNPPTYYSSHEVSNIWICPGALACDSQTSYAAHVMYFVKASDPSILHSVSDGCIVISSAAGTPNNLAWPSSGTLPTQCSDTTDLPAGSNYAWFTDLDTLTNNTSDSCMNWGQPAIMVTDAFSPGTPTMYLAAACFNGSFEGTYYVFSTTNVDLSWVPGGMGPNGFRNQWIWIGSFTPSDLATLGVPGFSQSLPINSITEFEWSLRPGPSGTNTVVAVLSPQNIASGVVTQYGCIALDFTMVPDDNQANPLGSNILASVTDSYAEDANGWEELTPGACAYEPASNIGIPIVRVLDNQNASSGAQKEYFILGSAVNP